jgi:hypothetical protein
MKTDTIAISTATAALPRNTVGGVIQELDILSPARQKAIGRSLWLMNRGYVLYPSEPGSRNYCYLSLDAGKGVYGVRAWEMDIFMQLKLVRDTFDIPKFYTLTELGKQTAKWLNARYLTIQENNSLGFASA